MVYDPQAERRRPKPPAEDAAPVEALLGGAATASGAGSGSGRSTTPDDPPPTPSVTPAPADPPPDSLLINTGLAGALAAVVGLLLLRHLWRRSQHARHRASENHT